MKDDDLTPWQRRHPRVERPELDPERLRKMTLLLAMVMYGGADNYERKASSN